MTKQQSGAYLDHNATSPLRPKAREQMLRCFENFTANPSSTHQPGTRARVLLDDSRAQIAQAIGAQPEELVLTSGGTESNHLGILGATQGKGPGKVITTAIEHPSVLSASTALEDALFEVVVVAPGRDGVVRVDDIMRHVDESTVLVSVQAVNHEVGTRHPIEDMASQLHDHHCLFHVDAVQAVGRIPINLQTTTIDLLSLSAHKIGGPMGIGALFVRKGTTVKPLLGGGSQEFGLRAGTTPVVLAVGFAAATEEAVKDREKDGETHLRLGEKLRHAVSRDIPEALLVTSEKDCAPGTVSLAFPGIDREALLVNLDLSGVFVSAGAACASGSAQPSPVLCAMGYSETIASSLIRVSFGSNTSENDIDTFLSALSSAVPNARLSETQQN